jgi:hypothetical protein
MAKNVSPQSMHTPWMTEGVEAGCYFSDEDEIASLDRYGTG